MKNPFKTFMASTEKVCVAIFIFYLLILVTNLATLLLAEIHRELIGQKILNLEHRLAIVEQALQER